METYTFELYGIEWEFTIDSHGYIDRVVQIDNQNRQTVESYNVPTDVLIKLETEIERD